MTKKIPTPIVLGIILILAVAVGAWAWWYGQKDDTQLKRQVFKTQEECEKTTGYKCSWGMCDYKCPNNDYWKGWASTNEKINQNNNIDTFDWQIYRNEEYGFEVKYPNDWTFRLTSQTYVYPRQISFAIQDKNYTKKWIEIKIDKDSQSDKNTPLSDKFIGGLPARNYLIPHPGEDVAVPQLPSYIGIWTEKDNIIYAIIFFNTEKIEGIYNQILSTFRFIP